MKLNDMYPFLLRMIVFSVIFYFGFVFVEQKWVPDYNDWQAARIPWSILIGVLLTQMVRWYIKKKRDTKESLS